MPKKTPKGSITAARLAPKSWSKMPARTCLPVSRSQTGQALAEGARSIMGPQITAIRSSLSLGMSPPHRLDDLADSARPSEVAPQGLEGVPLLLDLRGRPHPQAAKQRHRGAPALEGVLEEEGLDDERQEEPLAVDGQAE